MPDSVKFTKLAIFANNTLPNMIPFMNKNAQMGLWLFAVLMIFSCTNPRKFRYFQTEDNTRLIVDSVAYTLPKIQPNDVISVEVFALDPDVVRPFNQEGVTSAMSEAVTKGMPAAPASGGKGYLVDIDGFIDFPVLGKINVSGQNRIQVADVIRERLRTYVNNPRVNVSISSHKVTILGEVRSPGVYSMTSDRLTLDEAIAMSGDLTAASERSKIRVIREVNGKKIEYRVSILTPDFFRSPVYFLQNNDLIYVEPRGGGGDETSRVVNQIRSTVIMSINLVISVTNLLLRL
ncbi:MAG: hypothetical protein FGM54_06685 [Chitinophagaceae bacterium]|nr:hypothetical protein [Chitinophagaceae bacterium]